MKMAYIELAILVKEYFKITSGVIDSTKALRLIDLEKLIKEKVGVEK